MRRVGLLLAERGHDVADLIAGCARHIQDGVE